MTDHVTLHAFIVIILTFAVSRLCIENKKLWKKIDEKNMVIERQTKIIQKLKVQRIYVGEGDYVMNNVDQRHFTPPPEKYSKPKFIKP